MPRLAALLDAPTHPLHDREHLRGLQRVGITRGRHVRHALDETGEAEHLEPRRADGHWWRLSGCGELPGQIRPQCGALVAQALNLEHAPCPQHALQREHREIPGLEWGEVIQGVAKHVHAQDRQIEGGQIAERQTKVEGMGREIGLQSGHRNGKTGMAVLEGD